MSAPASHAPRCLTRPLGALAAVALAASGAAAAEAAPGRGGPHAPAVDAGTLAPQLAHQDLAWEDCALDPETGLGDVAGLECADVVVPLDWNAPRNGQTITVRISRVPATGGAERQGILLLNPGGPGGPGLEMAPSLAESAPALAASYDLIGFDPRGVERSTPLLCEVPTEALLSGDAAGLPRVLAEACRANPLARYITTEQTVHDMDLIREVLGEERTNYLGYSYGTWLGSWYQREFPQNSGRFVLDSSTDLTRKSLEETWDVQPYAFERQFRDVLLPYLSRHGAEHGVSGDAADLYRQFEAAGGTRTETGQVVGAIVAQLMYRAENYPIAAEIVAVYLRGELDGLDAAGPGAGPETGPGVLRRAAAVAGVDPRLAGLDPRLSPAVEALPDEELPERIPLPGAMQAVQCQDGRWQQSLPYWQAQRDKLARTAPFAGGVFSALPVCAHWPAVTEMPKPGNKKTHPESVILQSEMDPATAYEAGARSAKLIPNTTLVSVDDEVSHGVYPYGTACVDTVVERYLLTGVRPRGNVVCQGKPLPGDTAPQEYDGGVRAETARR
ncbi:alpha/beta fold hydrolase [Micrococcus sp.]|uniref:alpha/beta fold hydrolase n=1 Tax=Micrococcus sp. TaxID=1271 RepID=UPI002A920749|nr:alpha/beta fold hydrolase [Micrococcus sp.]MDY6055873.1 alpha/beta fold hydrolase [Micrococcus sp.]